MERLSYLVNSAKNNGISQGCFRAGIATVLLLSSFAHGNPTGGTVAAGSATISGTGTSSVTVNQASNIAIINWNSFSIDRDELTTFLQPSATSAVLNRVTGGGVSSINGTLNANGQVYLINGNGIFVGNGASINTNSFTASTLDIANSDFLKGNLQFKGTSTSGVQNYGSVKALGGDIYLIGLTVDNEGSLNAANGTVGLAAGQNVLIKQSGTQHVFVNPVAKPTGSPTKTGVTNNGNIAATAAELRAANGNMYALAINNGGTIRATSVAKQGGHIFLTSDSGTIVNTGTVDASATATKGAGGSITLNSGKTGTVVNRGSVVAHGGQGGTGGTVDLSGGTLDFTGGVDLTTAGGTTGNLLLDPSSITIDANANANGTVTVSGSTTTYTPAPGFTGSDLFNETLEAQLALANVIVNGVSKVDVEAPITWGNTTASTSGAETGSTLTLQTTGKSGVIIINAPITAHVTPIPPAMGSPVPPKSTLPMATLVIDDAGNGFVTTDVNGTIDVDNFTLKNGFWQQIVSPNAPTAKMPGLLASLPAFNVLNDFQLLGTSTFERFNGGNGLLPTARALSNAPYAIDDLFGLQGIGSPSDTLLSGNYVLDQNIGGDVPGLNTINWNGGNGTNGGAGFLPIGEGGKIIKPFTGTFNGQGFLIDGIYIYRPGDNLTGIFAEASGKITNTSLAVIDSEGVGISGELVGRLLSRGLVQSDSTTVDDDLNGLDPTAPSTGTTANQSQLTGILDVNGAAGGLVGEVMAGGSVIDSSSDISFELISADGAGTSGIEGLAGLVGVNRGTITNCTSDASGTTPLNVVTGGNPRATPQSSSVGLGGLVGINFGVINGGTADDTTVSTLGTAPIPASNPANPPTPVDPPTSSILSGVGNIYIGGFVGVNYGTIDQTITLRVNGRLTKETYQAFTNNDVTANPGSDIDGGTGSYYVGGFAGANYGTITNAYAAPTVLIATGFGTGTVTANGFLNPPGIDNGSGALGDYLVGGFAGGNFGRIISSGSEDTVITTGNISGIGTVTPRGGATVPATVTFTNPLAMDSYMVGGFVGLNDKGTITGSFSDFNDITIGYHLDPTSPLTAVADTFGDTFTLQSNGTSALVTTTGNITGGAGFYIVGGFAGGNYGTIGTSYTTGDVSVTGTTTQSNSFYTGGFAGVNSGVIANVYATGNATSFTSHGLNNPADQTGVVGGLVAQQNAGSITNTYSLGVVTGGTTRGGLVGVNAKGTIVHSFWDLDENPGLIYSAGGLGALGETEANLMTNTAGFPTSVFGKAKWNKTTIWAVPTGNGFLTLQGVP